MNVGIYTLIGWAKIAESQCNVHQLGAAHDFFAQLRRAPELPSSGATS